MEQRSPDFFPVFECIDMDGDLDLFTTTLPTIVYLHMYALVNVSAKTRRLPKQGVSFVELILPKSAEKMEIYVHMMVTDKHKLCFVGLVL